MPYPLGMDPVLGISREQDNIFEFVQNEAVDHLRCRAHDLRRVHELSLYIMHFKRYSSLFLEFSATVTFPCFYYFSIW